MTANKARSPEVDALNKKIAQQQQRIDKLEKIEKRYALAMDGANEGLWDWNPITKDLLISPRLMESLGYTHAQHLTTTHQWLQWVHPEDREAYENKVTEHLKGLSDYFEWEYRVRATNGTYEWVFARGKALRNKQGNAYRMVGSVGIITDRKIAEEKLKAAHDQLEVRVAERTKELTEVNRQLSEEIKERRAMEKELSIAKEIAEQANLSKDKYLAAASHDLLQPLNAARLLVSTLQERNLPNKETSLVNRIHTALSSAEELLTDLLDIARLDANTVTMDVSTFPANRMLKMLDEELQTVAKDAHVQLRTIPSRHYIQSDPRLLGRILRNFLSNAIRYSGGGKVLLGCRKKNDVLRFEVWDTGPGIPEDKKDEIFQEFRQLKDSTTPTLNKGIGLGLAIVERISKGLGHQVHVHSKLGKGSVFSVDVQLSTTPAPTSTTLAPSIALPQPDLSDIDILVIDNDGNITHSMADLLLEWGLRPHCALSGSAALSEIKYSRSLPQIILADYHLDNGETGVEAVQNIHHHFRTDIPTIIITADQTNEIMQECHDLGYYVLNKPLKPAKLRVLLNHLVSA